MREHRWLDEHTEELDIDMTLYNHNLKLWTALRLQFEVDGAGDVLEEYEALTLSLEPYGFHEGETYARFVCELLFISYILLEFVRLFKALLKCRRKCNSWNGADWNLLLSLSLNVTFAAYWIAFLIHPAR